MPRPVLPADPRARGKAKAEMLRDAESNLDRPFNVGDLRVRVLAVEVNANGHLVVACEAFKGARKLTLDLPFIYVNPPVLVDDTAGDITVTEEDGKTRRLRHDPAASFRQIVADTVSLFV